MEIGKREKERTGVHMCRGVCVCGSFILTIITQAFEDNYSYNQPSTSRGVGVCVCVWQFYFSHHHSGI